MITSYQAKYYAYELLKRASSDSSEKFGATLMDAQVELNPHQVEAALFAFKSPYSKGAILADEVGLGKTIEAGILLSQQWAENKKRILIICPSSLRKQWVNELSDKFYLKSEVMESRNFNAKYKDGNKNPFDDGKTIKICSYQYASKKADYIQLTSWDIVVLDEAHYLRNVHKNPESIAAKIKNAIKDYKKILLTATPLQNRLDELFGLVSIIDQTVFGDIKTFRKQYVNGEVDLLELKEKLKSIIHRTLRQDVREFVPYRERIPITQQFIPTKEETQLYNNVLNYLRSETIYALPRAQRHLMESVMFKLLGSSSFAIGKTLEALIKRLNTTLATSKVVEEEIISWFEEEYENFDDEREEEEEESEDFAEITLLDKENIEKEIAKLTEYLLLANSIEHNEKGEKLIVALDTGFSKLKELGANQKALIFTESTRTQKYLFERLSKEKYNGKIVLFNGNNNDELSGAIYQKWVEDKNNYGKLTHSKSVDIRNALVDAFKSDDYQIMIATEAAAEGINLQFCSMVVNYDLPWNPQRIEQRIGRCHRYGQLHDVVVVNFLNSENEVENRVFELLEQKYNLFQGVFGSSDHVLGAIENGVDFEKRMIEAYKKCRTKEEIEVYFKALEEEFKDAIDQRIKEVQSVLFENFEGSVINKLRITYSETKTFLEKFEKWLWEITRYYLKTLAEFEPEDFTFTLLDSGDRYTLNKKRTDARHYRIQSEVAQKLLAKAKAEKTDKANLIFDLSSSPIRYKELEQLRGTKGLLKISNLAVHSEIEQHDTLILTGTTKDKKVLSEQNLRDLLNVTIQTDAFAKFDLEELEKQHQKNKKQKLDYLEKTDAAFMQREFTKFEHWADDKIRSLEIDLKEERQKLRELEREQHKENILAEELIELQEKISKIKRKYNRLRQEIYDREDEINEQRDSMIAEAKSKLTRTIKEEELFTVSFEII
ncbi:MAG TPA: SNF2-related protein [Flavobacterium sp.]|nr:SNF2-related protein [Flavobacterium sp.]HRB66256.1 SNF2-related protein [Chitinophagales bacterium]